MKPGVYDLSLYRGDTYRWTFKLWADPGKTQPLDLTGVTVKSEIRDKPGGPPTLLTCTITAPPTSGVIDMVLATAQWVTIPAGGVWDMQLTYADGTVRTVVAGKVTVTADVTDSISAVARALRTA
jgi:hypothetical protein